jgi:hypothetical protein
MPAAEALVVVLLELVELLELPPPQPDTQSARAMIALGPLKWLHRCMRLSLCSTLGATNRGKFRAVEFVALEKSVHSGYIGRAFYRRNKMHPIHQEGHNYLPVLGNAQLTKRSENVAFSATFLPPGATFRIASGFERGGPKNSPAPRKSGPLFKKDGFYASARNGPLNMARTNGSSRLAVSISTSAKSFSPSPLKSPTA